MLSQADREFYEANGYVVVRQLFSTDETASYIKHYMTLRENGTYPGDSVGAHPTANDPLLKYPRMIHMHHWDEQSLQWLLDKRLDEAMIKLLGESPLAVQTMLYFKPPGARGQALHQDNFYLRVEPGTCMAAWLALDDCDEENGCMQVVPGSQDWPILCPKQADRDESFSDVTVPLPPGAQSVPVVMKSGDVLFFNGSIVHGSYPNRSNRFRRALIGHYVEGNTHTVVDFYGKVVRMDGTPVTMQSAPPGGPCGIWVDKEGNVIPEMVPDGLSKPVLVE